MRQLAIEWIMTMSVIILLIASFMASSQRDDLKAEAVKRGFAEWVPDYSGNTTFKWKEGTK